MLKTKLVIVFLMLLSINLFSQDELLTPTILVKPKLHSSIMNYQCPDIDNEKAMRLHHNTNVFAIKSEVNLTPENSGSWEQIENLMVWRLRLSSDNAYSMMMILEDINLPDYASLFLYNDDFTQLEGPFTKSYLNESNVLATPLIAGESITIELVYDKAKLKENVPYFVIKEVSHDFKNIISIAEDDARKLLTCHHDINCGRGTDKQIQKRAVVRLIVDGDTYGTGALINNTNNNSMPYVLTTHRVVQSSYFAERTVFYFNFERNNCGHLHNITDTTKIIRQTLTGADFITTALPEAVSYNNPYYTDFTLLKIKSNVPSTYMPFYAGWDIREVTYTNTYTIHHPKGDFKKITGIDNDVITFSNSDDYDYFYPNLRNNTTNLVNINLHSAWVMRYNYGAIEDNGSEGAPLFNEDGKIIGQLITSYTHTRAANACPNSFFKHDALFAKISKSWNGKGFPGLKDYLNPNNLPIQYIDGYIPTGWYAWRHAWLSSSTTNQNVHASYKSIASSNAANGRVYYRGEDNRMQSFFFVNNAWVHQHFNPSNITSQLVAGDIVAGTNNQVFYRGENGKMQSYFHNVATNTWMHFHLSSNPFSTSTEENVHPEQGSIAITSGNALFYRGVDNKIHAYTYSNSQYNHSIIGNMTNVAGDVVVHPISNQVFYRGTDNKINSYWYCATCTPNWQHVVIGGWNAPSSRDISSNIGALTIKGDTLFYRGSDNRLKMYYYSQVTYNWEFEQLDPDNTHEVVNVNGFMSPSLVNKEIYYRGLDGKMHSYRYDDNLNKWVHNWVESSAQSPSLHNAGGSISAHPHNHIFFRGSDARLMIYYMEAGVYRESTMNYNFDEEYSITIPREFKEEPFRLYAYPNPTTSNINLGIISQDSERYLVEIFDISGRNVLTDFIESNELKSLDLGDMISGMFIIKVIDNKGNSVVRKIIKE